MNRQEFPNHGWMFFQPQTGWWAPNPLANTFDQTVVNIIKHRQGSPAIVVKHNLSTNPAVVGAELEAFTIKRLGLPDPKRVPPPMPVPQAPVLGAVADAVAAVKKIAEGAALLLEWQESGVPPVSGDVASARALVCVDCPRNDLGGLTKYFTLPVSDNVRKRLAKLHSMNLTTPSDSKLGTCSACLCPLPLKIHTPMDLILKRLKPEAKAELDPRCWILKG